MHSTSRRSLAEWSNRILLTLQLLMINLLELLMDNPSASQSAILILPPWQTIKILLPLCLATISSTCCTTRCCNSANDSPCGPPTLCFGSLSKCGQLFCFKTCNFSDLIQKISTAILKLHTAIRLAKIQNVFLAIWCLS